MNVSEAIDEAQNFVDNTGSSQVDQSQRRLRLLGQLLEVVDFVRYFRDWAWRRTYGTLVIPTTGYEEVPADLLQIGKYGGVWDLSTGEQLDWVPEYVITAARVAATVPGYLDCYSIFDMDQTSSLQRIQLPPISSPVTLALAYDTKTPTLDETPTNKVNLVKAVPLQYHRSVLVPGLRAKARESKGDARWQDAQKEHMDGLKLMLRTERRGQGTVKQLPSFFGR